MSASRSRRPRRPSMNGAALLHGACSTTACMGVPNRLVATPFRVCAPPFVALTVERLTGFMTDSGTGATPPALEDKGWQVGALAAEARVRARASPHLTDGFKSLLEEPRSTPRAIIPGGRPGALRQACVSAGVQRVASQREPISNATPPAPMARKHALSTAPCFSTCSGPRHDVHDGAASKERLPTS